ncbi:single-stranded DNA-binding protein [Flavobacterium ginsenosidimutans]|uniref:single-stranded DNA-binding protein n=1 Tax=Flavobacterium ginsenosidimutans TaxID=687844 RepID=UPI000DAE1F16|nr:single-stranded DNA-binding protein [Flavobacterium ginsenosidimutans]KAF2328102.1 single-stranded DNA-binding protein [Flavobacterium ginsenosidimutans]
MEITGRVASDAKAVKVGEKEVLSFSIAVNDRYKPAGSYEFKEVATFINCSYWISMKAGQWVKKGAVVLLSGRLGMHVYINSDGNPIGSIDFHVDKISFLAFAKRSGDKIDTDANANANANGSEGKAQKGNSRSAAGKDRATEDVPF